ncbi:hypothetical protein Trydic_g14279 [Trypoxylus dichotomus]
MGRRRYDTGKGERRREVCISANFLSLLRASYRSIVVSIHVLPAFSRNVDVDDIGLSSGPRFGRAFSHQFSIDVGEQTSIIHPDDCLPKTKKQLFLMTNQFHCDTRVISKECNGVA